MKPLVPSLAYSSLKKVLSTKATRDELKRSSIIRNAALRNANVRNDVYEKMGKMRPILSLLVTTSPTNNQISQLFHVLNCRRIIGAAENKLINLEHLSPSVTNHETFRKTQIDINYQVFDTFANKTEKEWCFFFQKVAATDSWRDPLVHRMVNENPHCALRVSSNFINLIDHLTVPLCVEYDRYKISLSFLT